MNADIGPLLAAFSRERLARNGVPDEDTAADRRRCQQLLAEVLSADLRSDGLRCSPLGAEWTDVFDAHLCRALDPDRLAGRGWLPLASSGTWVVIEDGRVLASVRLRAGPPADPVTAVLARCKALGEVRLREVFELRELRRRTAPFPTSSTVLRVAAEIESGLGGRDLAPWSTGRVTHAPAELRGGRPARGLVVAVGGVDGSGKSTLLATLVESLDRAGIASSTVWVRPGMGIGRLASVAAWGKRLLRQRASPGIRAVADQSGVRLASRRGVIGWVWAALVSVSFLVVVRRQHRASAGLVLYDRHLVDAMATLDFGYEGVNLRMQRWLIQRILPRADVRLHLEIPVEVSVARKPDDIIGAAAIRRQLAAYEHWLDRIPPTARLDATRPPSEVAAEAVRIVLTHHARGHDDQVRPAIKPSQT